MREREGKERGEKGREREALAITSSSQSAALQRSVLNASVTLLNLHNQPARDTQSCPQRGNASRHRGREGVKKERGN